MAVAALTAAMCLPGCGPGGTIVSGVVKLDGRPVDDAILQFYPAAGDGQTSHAVADKQGRYRAIVSPVPVIVTISKGHVIGQERMFPGSPPLDKIAESLPPRYSDREKTELRVTPVEGKTTVADFTLTSEADK